VTVRLRFDRTTIDKFIAEDRIKSLKIGRPGRIPASEVSRFVREVFIESEYFPKSNSQKQNYRRLLTQRFKASKWSFQLKISGKKKIMATFNLKKIRC